MTNVEPFSENKVWGSVRHLFFSDECAISHLEVNKDSFCSVHKHAHRTNVFYMLSGTIKVREFGDGKLPTDLPLEVHTLKGQGATISIPKNVWHQFHVEESGSLIEIYHGTDDNDVVRHEDIIRYSVGGTL